MPGRDESLFKFKPFYALQERLKEGYSTADLRSDLFAGIVVGLVAVPLGMALAIASGVAPQHGLYTVILGGALVALLGGSRCQVTGPTAAFVVILAPITMKYGVGGLLIAGLMAGIILVIMGALRLGKLIEFIPHPVTTGFTCGIAVVIATLQIKDFFGLDIAHSGTHYVERVHALWNARGTASPWEFTVAAFTLACLVVWPKINKIIPAPLVALTLASALAFVLQQQFGCGIDTIHSRFTYETGGATVHGIPQTAPNFALPWTLGGPAGGELAVNFSLFKALLPAAFAIAMLGAIESLLSAVVADGMAQTRHDPDAELTALGIGNIVCPFFGGIPATGAIARTATNVRYGSKSPLSAIFHALFVLSAVLLFAPYLGYLPMSAMAALLLVVAYNMSEIKHFAHIFKVAPASDVAVLAICFGLTVMIDMVYGVTIGVVLAALIFMKRMSDLTRGQLWSDEQEERYVHDPAQQIAIYEIAGPLFFGAAQKAVNAMHNAHTLPKAVLLKMRNVPVMDVTGLIALETVIARLRKKGCKIALVGVQEQPLAMIKKSDDINTPEPIRVFDTVPEAVLYIKNWLDNPSKIILKSEIEQRTA